MVVSSPSRSGTAGPQQKEKSDVFSAGWVVLIAGSLVAGLAGTVEVELTGRALQGVGAALIAPSALTLLFMLFGARPKELTKALALYGAAAPAGGTAGVFLGGVITEYVDWAWVVYINIPIALVVLALVPGVMPAGGPSNRSRIDLLGAVTVTGGLAAAVYAVVQAPEAGWGADQTWLALGAAAVLLGLFVALQAKGREPLLRLGIFRAPNLAAANLAQLLLGAAWIPMWFFLNLYLQQVLGFSAFPSGAALLPMTGLIMLGMGWLSLVDPGGSFAVDVLPASLLAALGMSLAFIPTLGTAISAARPEEGGLASGIVNTSYQVGSALGLAVMTAVAAANGADQIGNLAALTDGYSAAFVGAAIIAVVGALTAGVFLKIPAAPVSQQDVVADRA